MKLFILVVATAFVALATPAPGEEPWVKEYPRIIEVPDGEGNMLAVDLEAEPDMEVIAKLERNPNNNEYLLFTRLNWQISQTLIMNNASSIRNSNFNPNIPSSVIVHNWLAIQDMDFERSLIDDIKLKNNGGFIPDHNNDRLRIRREVNVIVVSWSHLASLDYATASLGTPAIGRGIGQFITFLVQTTGARFQDFHLVGFGLGAHAAGNAGREVGGRVARVTGLDPAGPLWTQNHSNRIRPSDGIHVEAIHTNGGVGGFGIGMNVACCDIYVNNGEAQPDCLTNMCNHNRAWRVFADSIAGNQLQARRCTSYQQITWNTCRGETILVGNDVLNKTAGCGMYRLDTNRTFPY